jgi:hypothetical protein
MEFTRWAIFSRKGQNQFFSPSVSYSATVDHYYVPKSCFCVFNLVVEFNVLSKSGLGFKIGQLLVEISLLCHCKTSEITSEEISEKIENEKFKFFFVENHILVYF